MDLKLIDELVKKSTPEWAAKKVGSAVGKFAKENVHRVPKERKRLEQPPHKPKDPVLRNMADRVQKVGENMRRHYKMKPGEFEKYQQIAAQEAERTSKSIDEQTAEYFVKCHSHVLSGETEEGLKTKKKQAPKADGHTLGADPKDKRGSDLEMVEKKESGAYKSIDERTVDLIKSWEKREDEKDTPEGRITQVEETFPSGTKDARTMQSSKVEDGKKTGFGTDKFTHTRHDPKKGEVSISSHTWDPETKKYKRGTATYDTHVEGEANEELPKKSMMSVIDELLEKGKLRQVKHVKEGGAASGVRRPHLTEEQKKKLIAATEAKVKAYRTEGYMPDKSDTPEVRAQDKDPSNKSMMSVVDELIEKSLYDIVNRKKFSKIDPDAGINKKKEKKMDEEERTRGNNQNKGRGTDYDPSNAFERSENPDLFKTKRENKYRAAEAEGTGIALDRAEASKDPHDSSDSARAVRLREHRAANKSMDGEDLEKDWRDSSEANLSNKEIERRQHNKDVDYFKNKKNLPKNWNDPNNQSSAAIEARYFRRVGKKSIDEATCDLVKALTSERERKIHDAISTVRLARAGLHKEAREMGNLESDEVKRAAKTHNSIIAANTWRQEGEKSLKSVCDTWIGETSMIKGNVILPGNEMGNLAKKISTQPSIGDIEKKQELVMSGQTERERKAKKQIAAMKEPGQ